MLPHVSLVPFTFQVSIVYIADVILSGHPSYRFVMYRITFHISKVNNLSTFLYVARLLKHLFSDDGLNTK